MYEEHAIADHMGIWTYVIEKNLFETRSNQFDSGIKFVKLFRNWKHFFSSVLLQIGQLGTEIQKYDDMKWEHNHDIINWYDCSSFAVINEFSISTRT